MLRRRMMGKRLPDGWYKKEVALNGAYILTIDDYLVERRVWDTNDNSKAVGVAMLSDNCRYVIHPDHSPALNMWGWNDEVNTILSTTSMTIAKKDYLGNENTNNYFLFFNNHSDKAFDYCKNQIFKNGKSGYLGALGEWNEAYSYKDEIDGCMSLIGGSPFDTYNSYWASTQYNSSNSWIYAWRLGDARDNTRSSYYRVRAFATL